MPISRTASGAGYPDTIAEFEIIARFNRADMRALLIAIAPTRRP